jgi:hypothetical protein
MHARAMPRPTSGQKPAGRQRAAEGRKQKSGVLRAEFQA